ncbi:esterase/lipase family protein [Solilutibacter tolerans]|uniref:AB hydrolase-1 domain-containing protein n=1 Tax=Solilutibacter tolerans TaxID=1604334 RepID=A0A1N6QFL9_9GAMM|nr:alpha/beta fold hydrolase [Lysobacter tolerans]SIQ15397.1 hypothetical protein SAMN05421546_0688 [Lysobacter tolerans]
MPLHRLLAFLCVLWLCGCSTLQEFRPTVQARALTPGEYISVKRGDILTTGKLSAATLETLNLAALASDACKTPTPHCIGALTTTAGLTEEQRHSALAEVSLAIALMQPPLTDQPTNFGLDQWLQVARYSYAYLFFTDRKPGPRAFEDRQTQVRDYYNLASQEVAQRLFLHISKADDAQALLGHEFDVDGWKVRIEMTGMHLPANAPLARELVPASSLAFVGLHSTHRRDGLGAELIAVTDEVRTAAQAPQTDWSEMPARVVTSLVRFDAEELPQLMATRHVTLASFDPTRFDKVQLHGQTVPLAANFSAGYALWLARSGFNRQSLSSLFGNANSLSRAHLFLLEPFDPNRRILLMIHGLASSPEAWTNVANDVMGDEALRREYQIWQIYYPTNLPIPINHAAIRKTLRSALHHYDPQGTTTASHDMVVVGHSMGGIISRLLVSSSGDGLLALTRRDHRLTDESYARVKAEFGEILEFQPIPNITRAVFVAAPHGGTDVAGGWLGRQISKFVRLPAALQAEVQRLIDGDDAPPRRRDDSPLFNSVSSLDRNNPFVRAATDLSISPRVTYHSIIARADPEIPIPESDDGLVPYWSSHLDGAASERVITSGHSVQEATEAIFELRRILHQDRREHAKQSPTSAADGR